MYKENIKMKKLLIFFTILSSLLSPSLLFAQENETTTTRYFDVSIARIRQSGWNKAVTYEIYVTPKLDSSKTQILWDAPSVIDITPKHSEFVDLYKNETYTFKAKVKANRPGSYEISANLIAWQHDTNYSSSVSDNVTFNKNLLVEPVQPTYTLELITKYLLILIFIGGVIFASVVYGKKSIKSLEKWLTPPT